MAAETCWIPAAPTQGACMGAEVDWFSAGVKNDMNSVWLGLQMPLKRWIAEYPVGWTASTRWRDCAQKPHEKDEEM